MKKWIKNNRKNILDGYGLLASGVGSAVLFLNAPDETSASKWLYFLAGMLACFCYVYLYEFGTKLFKQVFKNKKIT